jgi:hypothetical protein
MKIKTENLSRRALDWAVAVAIGRAPKHNMESHGRTWHGWWLTGTGHEYEQMPNYSRDREKGQSLIEQEKIATAYDPKLKMWAAQHAPTNEDDVLWGETAIVAAYRCFVTMRLGNVVDVPDELVSQEDLERGIESLGKDDSGLKIRQRLVGHKEFDRSNDSVTVRAEWSPLQEDAINLLFALQDAWPYVHRNCTIDPIKERIADLLQKHGDFAEFWRKKTLSVNFSNAVNLALALNDPRIQSSITGKGVIELRDAVLAMDCVLNQFETNAANSSQARDELSQTNEGTDPNESDSPRG